MFDDNVPCSLWSGTRGDEILLGFILDNTRLEDDGILLPDEAYTNVRGYDPEFPATGKKEFAKMLEQVIDMAYGPVLDTGVVQRFQPKTTDTTKTSTAYRGLQLYLLEDD